MDAQASITKCNETRYPTKFGDISIEADHESEFYIKLGQENVIDCDSSKLWEICGNIKHQDYLIHKC
jgi:hypothetical protein